MTTYTTQPDGTDGIDTRILGSSSTTNYATDTTFNIGGTSSSQSRGLIKIDFTKGTNPPPGGATFSSASLALVCSTYNATKTLTAYQCLQAWVEAQATWNIFSTGNNWGTAGCALADTDYVNTDLGNVSVTGTGTFTITFNASGLAVINSWVHGLTVNNGFLLKQVDEASNTYNTYVTSDNATTGNRPLFTGEWTSGSSMFWF